MPGKSDTAAMMNRSLAVTGAFSLLTLSMACSGSDAPVRIGNAFVATPVASFEEPWAMTFLPDGRLLVTEKKGALKLLDVGSRKSSDISGVPKVAYGGQGGFGDVILHRRSWHALEEFLAETLK